MNKDGNAYIFTFAIVMVVVVAAILSSVSLALKPAQEKNKKIEKMQNILTAVNIESDASNAEELFNQFIIEAIVVEANGKKVEGIEAFDVDMKEEQTKIQEILKLEESLKEPTMSPFRELVGSTEIDKNKIISEIDKVKATRAMPVYMCKKEGEKYYVFPLRGKGLWGPIWGYLSLEDDFNTIYGTTFDHKSETPGLGAEIKESWFSDQFKGKQLFEGNNFVSVAVVKSGAPDGDLHAVDGISGGTVTSTGLDDMLDDCMGSYQPYFNANK